MKKIVLILLVLCAACIYKVNAQFYVGVKGGLNFAMLTDTTSKGYEGVLLQRFNYGVFVNYRIQNDISVQTEFNYSGRGEKEVNGSDYNMLNMNYFEVPVLVKYTFGKDKVQGFVEGGPYVAYWKRGEIKYKLTEYEMTGKDNYNFNDVDLGTTVLKDNRLDLGLNLGCGASYALTYGNIFVDARFGYGLSNVNKYTGEELPGWVNKKHRVLSISLGYEYNLGKH